MNITNDVLTTCMIVVIAIFFYKEAKETWKGAAGR